MTDDTIKVTVDAEAVDNMTWAEFALMSDYFTSPRESGGLMKDIIAILDGLCTVSVGGEELGSVGEVRRKDLADTVAQIFTAIQGMSGAKN